ncbi:hypothetical protein AWV79_04290 [Cupriavidus sp. UYMMa02A]|nr:hypothetical protein AWV79_04290 [Cupriavidus sp. UYMMa02A]
MQYPATHRGVFKYFWNSTQGLDSLRYRDPEFRKQAAQPIDESSALLYPTLAQAMECSNALLLYRLNLNETHPGPCGSLADCFGISRIILAARTALSVWGNKLRRDQLHPVAHCSKFARPVMGGSAGLHRNIAGLQSCHELGESIDGDGAAQDDTILSIDAVQLGHALR